MSKISISADIHVHNLDDIRLTEWEAEYGIYYTVGYDPECGIAYDPREDDDYPPFTASVLCHNNSCKFNDLREVVVYHPSEEFNCDECGQRMW